MSVSEAELKTLRQEFEGGWIDDDETKAVINTSTMILAISSIPIRRSLTASA